MAEHETTAFRTSPARMAGLLLLLGVVAWVIAQAALALVARRPPADLSGTAGSGVVFVVAFTALSFVFHRRNWPAVDVTDAGLGLVDKGRGVVLPWQAIESAVIRHVGPLATLRVTLRPEAVPPAATLRPRVRAGRPEYRVHIGTLRPSTKALRAALARQLPAPTAT